MEHMTNTDGRKQATHKPTSGVRSHKDRTVTAARVSALLKGIVVMGASYLLGTCAFPFGALPLGFSLICASATMAPYAWIGLCLSALHPTFPLPFWAGWTVYTLTLLFRLMFSYLTSSDQPPKAVSSPSAGDRLKELTDRLWKGAPDTESDTATDYYYGKRNTPVKIREEEPTEVPTEEITVPSSSLFRESMVMKMLTSALGGFAFGLWGMFAGGFAFYDLLTFLLTVIAAPIFTYLLSFSFTSEGQALLFASGAPDVLPRRGHTHLLERFSALTLCSGLLLLLLCTLAARVHVISLWSPYVTVRIAPILALVLSLRTTAGKGMIPGMIVAILCGLGADPMLSPAFILGVLAYSALRFLSHRAATVSGCMAALLWTMLGGGISNLVTYLPSMLLTIPICLALQKLSCRFPSADREADRTEAMNDFTSAMEQRTRAEAHRSRLEALSGAFTSLSRMFYDLSGQLRRPQMNELKRLCDEVMDRHCARCRHRDECDKAVCHPADLITARLATQLYHKGKADMSCLPPETASDCLHLSAILEDVNTRCAKLTEHLLKSEKTEVFATDYESVADLIRDTLDEDEEEYRCNREAADKIFDFLSTRGVTVLGVVVCGKRNCRIIVRGDHFDRSERSLSELHTAFEDICATRLTFPTFEVTDDTSLSTVMQLSSAAIYDTVYAGSTVPADIREGAPLPAPLTNEKGHGDYIPPVTCGDHIALFKSENACFYALISDGMGSGEDASLTSDICALFLEKMLSAGNRVELSVRMLNSFIRQKNNGTGDECSATVDLMELDLMSGQAVFAKNGAAPTYVVRGGRVYKLRSRTLPIGILKDSDPQLLRFRMHPGDVVVMVSDGVTHGNDECPWLIDLLSDPLPESMDSLRLKILRRAIASGSPDDLSAIAVRVENK